MCVCCLAGVSAEAAAAASALDALLRLAVDEATAEDDPTFGRLLEPDSETVRAACVQPQPRPEGGPTFAPCLRLACALIAPVIADQLLILGF